MKTIAIITDHWKLRVFEKLLTDGNFKYTTMGGLCPNTVTVMVETDKISDLADVVSRVNLELAH